MMSYVIAAPMLAVFVTIWIGRVATKAQQKGRSRNKIAIVLEVYLLPRGGISSFAITSLFPFLYAATFVFAVILNFFLISLGIAQA